MKARIFSLGESYKKSGAYLPATDYVLNCVVQTILWALVMLVARVIHVNVLQAKVLTDLRPAFAAIYTVVSLYAVINIVVTLIMLKSKIRLVRWEIGSAWVSDGERNYRLRLAPTENGNIRWYRRHRVCSFSPRRNFLKETLIGHYVNNWLMVNDMLDKDTF